ncbi:helix-turn-helix domain-containing protein [Gellertiella hungarica]|uniref:Transcriptional regulator with XRE-family HTH domain n=1 Tax=Gellertiella hungarica TaxID=1572859 RepID=A0A7W6NMZ6_9HYPH|nr:helix-turn-helix transcriptional regulator [Gellertiella hungarica]MBB4067179.1 transcriptional regulator with XRE-family HTH domain [Gellertiella hungarica]
MADSLRAARSVLSKSQEQVAGESGINFRTLRRLEEGSYIRLPYDIVVLKKYYEREGIEFLAADDSQGPGLSWPSPKEFDPSHRDKIRVGRNLANLSQREFAALSGIGQSVISRIESGQNILVPVKSVSTMLSTLEKLGVLLSDAPNGTRSIARLATKIRHDIG